jgi:RNA polymerase-interacting CarD/CdnL/TRCF family regulator
MSYRSLENTIRDATRQQSVEEAYVVKEKKTQKAVATQDSFDKAVEARKKLGGTKATHMIIKTVEKSSNFTNRMYKENNEVDDEGNMAKGELKMIAQRANEIMSMLDDNTQLEGWVQSKITKAEDYINSVYDYMKGQKGN